MVYIRKTKRTYRSRKPRSTFRRPRSYYRLKYPRAPVETKHYDRVNTVAVTQTGTLQLLSGVITQGVDDSQRIGDTIFARYLNLKLILLLSSQRDNVRIIIFKDIQGYNSPTVSDVLEPGQTGSGYAPIAQYNHYFMSRFKILYDKTYRLNVGANQTVSINRWIPIRSNLHYVGGATFKNQIWMLLITDESNILQLPVCNYVTRLSYNDL